MVTLTISQAAKTIVKPTRLAERKDLALVVRSLPAEMIYMTPDIKIPATVTEIRISEPKSINFLNPIIRSQRVQALAASSPCPQGTRPPVALAVVVAVVALRVTVAMHFPVDELMMPSCPLSVLHDVAADTCVIDGHENRNNNDKIKTAL